MDNLPFSPALPQRTDTHIVTHVYAHIHTLESMLAI